jgi:hypothetical protein
MATVLPFGELFGFDPDDRSPLANQSRSRLLCPFRGTNTLCNKGNRKSPLSTCSLSDGDNAVSICPSRFLEGGKIFQDAGRLVFGPGTRAIAISEVSVLKNEKTRVGKVDFMVFRIDAEETLTDQFFAMEVQAVYISGKSVRPALAHFKRTGQLPEPPSSRPDYRSSAQKRLIPQLSVKMPIFRRWGIKYFVVIDAGFFAKLPQFQQQQTLENSEITWLVYPMPRRGGGLGFTLGEPAIVHTTEQAVEAALAEGRAPTRAEIMAACVQRVERSPKRHVHLPVVTIG